MKKNKVSQQEACEYIAEIAQELQDVAKAADMQFLSYLIGMVGEEAKSATKGETCPGIGHNSRPPKTGTKS